MYNSVFSNQECYIHIISIKIKNKMSKATKQNRIKGGIQHGFDVVIGPVADDDTMETVQLYIGGVLTADEAVMIFNLSSTYKVLQQTENGLWAESAEYIANRFMEERSETVG